MSKLSRRYSDEVKSIREQGLYKEERVITTPQGVLIKTRQAGEVLNFCANNYLGLANHEDIVDAAMQALRDHGFGMASVRFICGTQDLHKQLESAIAEFLGTEDAILYSSCFDANTGLFETLLDENDAIISDALNHASIIDGVRLCKAKRFRYAHADMAELEAQLHQAQSCRTRLIATDGVFSMDGDIAKLDAIVELAEKYQALVMVDDSHATGVIGATGRGSAEYHNVMQHIDIYTSTLGKAMGGGSGGFTASSQDVVDLLRQRSRPYLFSNTMMPALAAAGIKAVDGPVEAIDPADDCICVTTADDTVMKFASIYPALGSDTHTSLAEMVGAKLKGDGCLWVDDHQRCSIEGLYAAGDVVIGLDQISNAMGQGGVASTTMRNDLSKKQPIRR